MKFLLVVALLAGVQAEAEAEPEADPQLLLYGGVGAVAHVPTIKVVETPAEVKTTVNAVPYVLTHPGYVGYTGYTGYTGLHGYYPYYGLLPATVPAAAAEAEAPAVAAERKKREAEAAPEADAEADPWLYYSGLHHPVTYHAPLVTTVKAAPVKTYSYSYSSLGYPYGLGYHGGLLGYHGGYLGYPYLLPAVAAAKEEEAAPAVTAERKKREAEAVPEADAEADPWLYYSGLYHPVTYHAPVVTTVKAAPVKAYTYSYSSLGYPYGLGYHGGLLGYHGGYLGYPYLLPAVAAAKEEEAAPAVTADRKKREAVPEAEPEADPAILASYSRVLSAPTPIIHVPVHAAYTAPLTYAGYGYGHGYPYLYGK